MKPIVIKSQFILAIASWFNGFPVVGLSHWPIIVVDQLPPREKLLNHEVVHHVQQAELLLVGFWILYPFFFLRGLLRGLDWGDAYDQNPFEREAYENEVNKYYISVRQRFAWTKYL